MAEKKNQPNGGNLTDRGGLEDTPQAIQDRENVTIVLQQEMEALSLAASTLVQDSKMTSTELISYFEKIRSDLRQEALAEFSQYTAHKTLLKLDPNTANKQLVLSEGNTKATLMREEQPYPDHQRRFIDKRQVLSAAPLTGRHSWEVEWTGLGATVGVAYEGINRAGEESLFGKNNDKSWVLDCRHGGNYKHNDEKIPISGLQVHRVGVFLDYEAGVLAFYGLSGGFTLLHRVDKITFTQPLHACFGLYHFGATAKFVE